MGSLPSIFHITGVDSMKEQTNITVAAIQMSCSWDLDATRKKAEKFYFTPGDTGFRVWNTRFGKLGIGICWDQWFPEAARAMALMGAELLLYPTAIGSEPYLKMDSRPHWQNTMCGHAAANLIPVIAANRVGTETDGDSSVTFYGSSFITDNHGCIAEQMNRTEEGFILHPFDLKTLARERREWGVFRDRRPEMYRTLLTYGEN